MAIRAWKCKVCGEEIRTKVQNPLHCEQPAELMLTAPNTKFMEKTDPEKGKSAVIGQQKILRERARSHSRDVEMDDLIQTNEKQVGFQNGWVKRDGNRRKKIDDI